MLAPGEAEAARLARQIPEIFALTAALADVPETAETLSGAVPMEALRTDTAAEPDEARRNIRLSKNEKEGFVRVARTVG